MRVADRLSRDVPLSGDERFARVPDRRAVPAASTRHDHAGSWM
ncbi:hypothetical protein [Micromonospora saelicesensis]|nr:hypothetical protein [Micromonospora saelicesensis]